MAQKKSKNSSPRIKVIQKLYNSLLNPNEEIDYPKGQYKKFIKDVVSGTLERSDLIEETINSLHVINAPSPAATACLAIADEIVKRVLIKNKYIS